MTDVSEKTLRYMTRFLEARGWEHYPDVTGYEGEAWLLPGRIQFEGDDALLRAYHWQVQQESV